MAQHHPELFGHDLLPFERLACAGLRTLRHVSVAVKKGAILAPLAPGGPLPSRMSLSLLLGGVSSERPGAVKGAPLLGAAKRTLDREDRSGRLEQERKAQRRTSERWSQKMAPLPGATDTPRQARTE